MAAFVVGAVLVAWQWQQALANARLEEANAAAEAEARKEIERTARAVEVLLLGAEVDRAVKKR